MRRCGSLQRIMGDHYGLKVGLKLGGGINMVKDETSLMLLQLVRELL